jgi:hypothetical protein
VVSRSRSRDEARTTFAGGDVRVERGILRAGDATHPLSPGGNAHRTTRSGRRMVRARFSAVRWRYDVIAVRRMGASSSGSVVVLEPSVWGVDGHTGRPGGEAANLNWLAGGSTMPEESGAKGAPHRFTDAELVWMREPPARVAALGLRAADPVPVARDRLRSWPRRPCRWIPAQIVGDDGDGWTGGRPAVCARFRTLDRCRRGVVRPGPSGGKAASNQAVAR